MRDFQAEYDKIQDDIRNKRKDLQTLAKEWAKHSVVKIGDTVTANGYSYTGKKMIVEHIDVEISYRGTSFLAEGKVLKKNGKPGLQRGEYREKIN